MTRKEMSEVILCYARQHPEGLIFQDFVEEILKKGGRRENLSLYLHRLLELLIKKKRMTYRVNGPRRYVTS